MKQKAVAIVGPTASGKSALAVLLAHAFKGEVISADSRQVYRGLDIGSGKVTRQEMQGITHHLLSVIDPKKQFSVAEYKKLAQAGIEGISKRNKLPIIAGGTGLYIDALLQDISLPEVEPNTALRKTLEKKPAVQLFSILQKLDPARAKTIDRHNPVRLIRAIEIAKAIGKVPKLRNKASPYHVLAIGLLPSADRLKQRINIRIRSRLSGMIREIKALHKNGLSWKRMETLGLEYRYISRYVRGLASKQEVVDTLEKEIRQYARRQMTWFKRDKNIHWFDPEKKASEKSIRKLVKEFMAEK